MQSWSDKVTARSEARNLPRAAPVTEARHLLSVTEAARFVGLSASAFRSARKRRPCPSYRPTGPKGREHFAEADLIAWVEASKTVPVRAVAERRVRPAGRRGRQASSPWAEVLGRNSIDIRDAPRKLDGNVLRPEERIG